MRRTRILLVEVGLAVLLNITAGLLQRPVAIALAKFGWWALLLTILYFVASDQTVRPHLRRLQRRLGTLIWWSVLLILSVGVALFSWYGISKGCDRLFAELPNAPSSKRVEQTGLNPRPKEPASKDSVPQKPEQQKSSDNRPPSLPEPKKRLTDGHWSIWRQGQWWEKQLSRVIYCSPDLHGQSDKITHIVELHLFNRTHESHQIVAYTVEVKNDKWVALGRSRAWRADSATYVEIVSPGIHDPTYVDVTGKELDRFLVDKSIPAGSSVGGLVLLNYYKNQTIPEINAISPLRIIITNADGTIETDAVAPYPIEDLGRMTVPKIMQRGWKLPCDIVK
jgi:hypothetical protein